MQLRRSLTLSTVYACAFAFAGWTVGLTRLKDNSFLWHLRTGELILDEGIPRSDPYSYTAEGTRWIAQSWLAELLYGVLHELFGAFSIRVLTGVLGASIGVLAFLLAARLTDDRLRAGFLTAAALGGLYASFSSRPLLIGVLFLLLLVWLVELPESWLGRHEPLVIPVALWLWVNVHGTFVLGFAYLALHLVGRWLEGTPPWVGRERRILLGSLVAVPVIFLNPYGWRLVLFPLSLVARGEELRRIVEWRSPDFTGLSGIAFAVWLAVFIVVVARRGLSRRDLVVAVPFLLLGLWAVRNVALAPLVMLPIAARAISREAPQPVEPLAPPGRVLLVALLLGVVGIGAVAASEPDFNFAPYPVDALAAVRDDGLQGRRLLTTDATSGYVILTQWPDQKVFSDDRVDMYPSSVLDAYVTLADGDSGWREALDRYDVEVIVWPVDRPLAELLALSDDWVETYEDDQARVWVRSGVEPSS